jgi:hypothetical protein
LGGVKAEFERGGGRMIENVTYLGVDAEKLEQARRKVFHYDTEYPTSPVFPGHFPVRFHLKSRMVEFFNNPDIGKANK